MLLVKFNKLIEKQGPAPLVFVVFKVALRFNDHLVKHIPFVFLYYFYWVILDELEPHLQELALILQKHGPKRTSHFFVDGLQTWLAREDISKFIHFFVEFGVAREIIPQGWDDPLPFFHRVCVQGFAALLKHLVLYPA